MSFKREGNDPSLLSKLRKRRVNELLGESIPDDEAKLLSNGRFSCSVCNNIPILDTVNMLTVHRRGKKHLANLEIFESKKRELKELKWIRRQQQFLKDGTTDIQMAAPTLGGILHTAPYDSRVKRSKLRPTDRKMCVNLDSAPLKHEHATSIAASSLGGGTGSTSSSALPGNRKSSSSPSSVWRCGDKSFSHTSGSRRPSSSSFTSQGVSTPKFDQPGNRESSTSSRSEHPTTSFFDLPGNRKSSSSSSGWQTIAQQQLAGPVIHDRQLKNVFCVPKADVVEHVRLTPYQGKRGREMGQPSGGGGGRSLVGLSTGTSHSFEFESLRRKSSAKTNGAVKHFSVFEPEGTGREMEKQLRKDLSSQNTSSTYSSTTEPGSLHTQFQLQTASLTAMHGSLRSERNLKTTNGSNHTTGMSQPGHTPGLCTGTAVLPPARQPGSSMLLPPPPPPPQLTAVNCMTQPPPPQITAVNCMTQPPPPHQTPMNDMAQPPQPARVVPLDKVTAQKLRQLQGSGWKRDWDGKWIKDDDAEFDSDEEPPDIP